MRKLRLDIDQLRVETFATAEEQEASGTVLGNMPFKYPASDDSNCGCGSGSDPSGYESCPCTQRYSCPNGCTEFCTVVECPTQATYCC